VPQHKIEKRRLWRRFLVLCGLSAAAVAAPLLDLYGKNPEVFVANRSTGGQIIVFGFLVTLAMPLLALALLAIADVLGPRFSARLYLALLILGGVGTGLVISRQAVPGSTYGAVALALGVATLILLVHRWFESSLRLIALALPAVLIAFLAFSPTSRLVWVEPAVASPDTGDIGLPAPIIFIQLDEFPTASVMELDGSINRALFPNIARLADSGSWYRNAFSASIATTQSVPAAVTGRLGDEDLSPTAIDHPDSLFTLLDGAYEMHVIEWVADLCPDEVCEDYAGRAPARFTSLLQDVAVVYGHLTLPSRVRDDLPSIGNSWKGFVGQQENPPAAPIAVDDHPVPDTGERSEWIDWMQRIINGITEDAPPTLHYVHLKSPHVPWSVNPSGTHYQRPEQYTEVDGIAGSGRWIFDQDIARLGFQRHLYQLGFLDKMIGSLFQTLDETTTWDDAMIVLVADHGASFVPGQHRRWPFEDNRDDLYRIPLFVKYPGQTVGEIRDEPAFTIDILPTIVKALDISTDWAFDGLPLQGIEGTNRPHQIIHWCCSREGASTDIARLFDQVERNHQWVPNQESWLGVAAVGPYADRVGKPVSDLAPDISDELRWTFDYEDGLTSVDRGSGFAQTLITGRLELPDGIQDDQLLVAVNGEVAGAGFVSRDTATGGQIRALIAEEMLQDGRNEVSILIPDLEGGGWLTGSADDVALQYLADDGHTLELRPEGDRRIQIDDVNRTDSGWNVVGWAADIRQKRTPDRVYVFAGDVLVAFGPPNLDNKNVVRWYGSDDLLRSGFTFDIDSEAVPDQIDRLTVVAEFGDYAIGDPASLAG
jgi:hypothetical protein